MTGGRAPDDSGGQLALVEAGLRAPRIGEVADPGSVAGRRLADRGDPVLGLDEPEPSWAGAVTWRQTDRLRDALYRQLEAPGTMDLRLDVRAVTSIDAAGIGVLVGANHRAAAAGRRMVLIDSNGPVTAALSRRRLLGLFHATQVVPEGDAHTSPSSPPGWLHRLRTPARAPDQPEVDP